MEQSRDVVDVVVGEIMRRLGDLQPFILEFHEIIYIIRNYLPILSIKNFTGNFKYQFLLKLQISQLFTSSVILNIISVIPNYIT